MSLPTSLNTIHGCNFDDLVAALGGVDPQMRSQIQDKINQAMDRIGGVGGDGYAAGGPAPLGGPVAAPAQLRVKLHIRPLVRQLGNILSHQGVTVGDRQFDIVTDDESMSGILQMFKDPALPPDDPMSQFMGIPFDPTPWAGGREYDLGVTAKTLPDVAHFVKEYLEVHAYTYSLCQADCQTFARQLVAWLGADCRTLPEVDGMVCTRARVTRGIGKVLIKNNSTNIRRFKVLAYHDGQPFGAGPVGWTTLEPGKEARLVANARNPGVGRAGAHPKDCSRRGPGCIWMHITDKDGKMLTKGYGLLIMCSMKYLIVDTAEILVADRCGKVLRDQTDDSRMP